MTNYAERVRDEVKKDIKKYVQNMKHRVTRPASFVKRYKGEPPTKGYDKEPDYMRPRAVLTELYALYAYNHYRSLTDEYSDSGVLPTEAFCRSDKIDKSKHNGRKSSDHSFDKYNRRLQYDGIDGIFIKLHDNHKQHYDMGYHVDVKWHHGVCAYREKGETIYEGPRFVLDAYKRWPGQTKYEVAGLFENRNRTHLYLAVIHDKVYPIPVTRLKELCKKAPIKNKWEHASEKHKNKQNYHLNLEEVLEGIKGIPMPRDYYTDLRYYEEECMDNDLSCPFPQHENRWILACQEKAPHY